MRLPAIASAPIAQWIEYEFAELGIEVRFLLGALAMAGGDLVIQVRFLAGAIMIDLKTPLSQFPTVKTALCRRLNYLGLKTAQDLLFYLPFRYDDLRASAPIAQVRPGMRLTVRGRLQLIANKRSVYRRRLLTEAVVADETGQLKVIWFNQPYLMKVLNVGDQLALAGKVEQDKFGLAMISPIFEKEKRGVDLVHTGRLVPFYPTTEGLTQKHLRFLIKQSLPALEFVKEWLPPFILKKYSLLDLPTTLAAIHFPPDEEKSKQAQERLKFGELFLLQLRNELTRQELRQSRAPVIQFKEKETKDFVSQLPFQLTTDQRRAAWEILQDLPKGQPMNRLLDGDVGSGKTLVAALAIYNAILNGYQAVLMAPTEILAMQHSETMTKLFKDQSLTICLLTSGSKTKKEIIGLIKKGDINLIIGTHALLEEKVQFKNLGLAIVDEQHRFGVKQRQTLAKKSGEPDFLPHFLSLTATPIPRSLSLACYGDLDLSLIKEMPKERKKIMTRLVEEINRPKAYEFVRQQVKTGRQVFVICPLIEDKEQGTINKEQERKSVLAEYKKLSEEIFPDLRVNYLHGRMKSQDKEKIMKDFLEKRFDILVSTSVVEVGVDIPNASVMMIEGAERFGLAQLHQFRGRVGRSASQSYCLLFTNTFTLGELAKQRLSYFVASRDGFELAEKDLELRGPGEVFGASQHGFPELKIATLGDIELIKKSREAAKEVLDQDRGLRWLPALKQQLVQWTRGVHLE